MSVGSNLEEAKKHMLRIGHMLLVENNNSSDYIRLKAVNTKTGKVTDRVIIKRKGGTLIEHAVDDLIRKVETYEVRTARE